MNFDNLGLRLDESARNVLANAKPVSIPKDARVFAQGDACKAYILVIEGSVKVFSRTAGGREILLYRVKAGESCTLTTSCLLANNHYPAESIAETDVKAIALPVKDFNLGLQNSAAFRQFVFNAYGERIRDVIHLVETVSFGKIDVRLAEALIAEMGNLKKIEITHQQLAVDLGTAREVVSRHLKNFEKKGWIRLARGSIEMLDYLAIQALALEKDE